MAENFIILSLPYQHPSSDSSLSGEYDALTRQVGPLGTRLHQFAIPELMVGTLDSLMEASDDLSKMDPLLENTVLKLVGLMEEISQKPRNVVTTFRINHAQDMTPAEYIKSFMWSSAQFDPKDSIPTLVRKFEQISAFADERVRVSLTEFNDTRNRVNAANRKGEGNLSVRPIREIVSAFNAKHQCFVTTDLLATVFVAVPTGAQKEWLRSYWTLSEFACPQSSTVVAEDSEYILNSVVIFSKVLDDFKNACRKQRFLVREVNEGDDLSSTELKELQQKMETERKTLYTVSPKREEEIRKRLAHIYSDLSAPYTAESSLESGALQCEYPYVSLKVSNIQK